MPRPKARRTKQTMMQARMDDRTKRVLQEYADSQGISLSAVIQKTLNNLADIVDKQRLAKPK